MTKETAEAIGLLTDRLIRPVVTFMFACAICWMAVRTIQNISADQFVGVVMMVIGFWFATRGGANQSQDSSTTVRTDPGGTTATVAVTKP